MFPGSINKDSYAETYQEYQYLSDKDSVYTCDSEDNYEDEKVGPDLYNKVNTEDLDKSNNNIFYNYNISDSLKTDFVLFENKCFPAHLCIFNINTENLYPYLSYLLVKNHLTNVLQFPYLVISSESNVAKEVDIYMQKLSVSQYNLQGYKIEENEMYIFIEIKNNNQLIFDYNYFYFALMDELTNGKEIFDLKIDYKISNFFIQNPEFIFILDTCNKPFEIPISAYQGIDEKKLGFTFMFGVTKSSFTELMGPYFYFTSYKNVVKKFNDKKIKYGIIRYGLFLGCMKIPMNFPEDDIDTSATKTVLFNNVDTKTDAILTMRISDHDGVWTEIYDSVYLGRTELDNGEFLQDTPTWVLKKYNQQFSLSYKIIYPKIKFI